jgi:isovaleryl-CoA dehydrogenase
LGLGYLQHCAAIEEVSCASGQVGLSFGAHSNQPDRPQRRHGPEGALPAEADIASIRLNPPSQSTAFAGAGE